MSDPTDDFDPTDEFNFSDERDPSGMDLSQIERELLEIHDSLNVRTTALKARRRGLLLEEVRNRLGHGQWGKWLKRIGLGRTTAQSYRQVAAHFEEHPEDVPNSAH